MTFDKYCQESEGAALLSGVGASGCMVAAFLKRQVFNSTSTDCTIIRAAPTAGFRLKPTHSNKPLAKARLLKLYIIFERVQGSKNLNDVVSDI